MEVEPQALVAANIGVPRLGEGVTARPRPAMLLSEAISGSRLVYVVAPAGAGKTTLVAQVVGELDLPVCWLTIEHWDRSPGRLLRDLVSAIATAVPAVRAAVDRIETEDARERAAAVGAVLGDRSVVLVVDNVEALHDATSAADVLGVIVGRSRGVRSVLVGRSLPSLPGLGADLLACSATIGDDVIRADVTEAEAILRARGLDADPFDAVASSQGWITGLVLEPGRAGSSDVGRLELYLRSDVRPKLTPEEDAFLLRAAAFDHIDRSRAIALGGTGGPELVAALRRAGVPGVWDSAAATLRIHPRVRELLRAALDGLSTTDRRDAFVAIAGVHLDEGQAEQAVDAFIAAGDLDRAGELLPTAILAVVRRLDVEQARRLLDAVPCEQAPPEVMYATLCLALYDQAAAAALPVLDALEDPGAAEATFAQIPEAGALAVLMYFATGRLDAAVRTFESMPAGRARDTARLTLADLRDDPSAPIPPLQGDMLDALIARGMYSRGMIGELQTITSSALLFLSGVPDLASRASGGGGMLASRLDRLRRAVSTRDLAAANTVVEEFEAMPFTNIFTGLCEAEIAIRIERNAERALRGLERSLALPEAENASFRETIEMWRGAAYLLRGTPDAAARELRTAAESMSRGGRFLLLPTTLVYLAEAEWQLGRESESDALTVEAYAVARENGDLGRLILALADFPGVLSRAIDLQPGSDSTWHALGRAIRSSPSRTIEVAASTAHIREFGEPALVIDGVAVRPKIRKSIELLSFLLSTNEATASRSEVLTALWNGRDDDSSRAYLRQALRHLRGALADGETIAVAGGMVSVVGAFTSETNELEALRAAAAETTGPAQRALLLEVLEIGRRGEFLQGSNNVRWIDERRAQIGQWLVDARLTAAESLLDEGRLLDALELVDDVVVEDPRMERACRLRMQALAMLGDHDGVAAALRTCRDALHELGLVPSRGTVELANRLRS